MTDIQFIDNPEKLESFCQQLKPSPWLAIDTEFLREKTYYPIFCLMQIATPDVVGCIDPLTIPSLDPMFDILFDTSKVKVFHSGRQDLEIIYQLSGKVPSPLFDTQIAAPLLGQQTNAGYGSLVSHLLNINLSKTHTRTDWSQRPLSQEQLNYAADDVIYLGKIYLIMQEQLQRLGRAGWLEDDFLQLANSELYKTSPEDAWHRIKSKNKLTEKQLSIIQVLSHWREQTAQSENRPRNWLIKDETILDMAKIQPTSTKDLFKLRGLNERTIKRHGSKLCELVRQGQLQPPKSFTQKRKSNPKTPNQEAVLDILSAFVRIKADEHSINPASLASRKDLEKFLLDSNNNPITKGWRNSLVGQELKAIINGQYSILINQGQIKLSPLQNEG